MNVHLNNKVYFQHLGLLPYADALEKQVELFELVIAQKLQNRTLEEGSQKLTNNYLLFCQHPHVYTLGRSGAKENLLINEAKLAEKNAIYVETNRGGDITYHGPGQLVGYPILDLDNFFTDIHKYLRFLEQSIILTLKDFGIVSGRIEGLTGVWVEFDNPSKARKIGAFGVKASRWVTMHGFALNINSDLDYFNNIIPCGISDKAVTSMAHELGKEIDIPLVENRVKFHLGELFTMKFV